MKLQLFYPVKPVHINQAFGANPQIYSQPQYGKLDGHNGIDFMAFHGQPVYASHDGMAYYEVDSNQGDGFVIRTNETYDDGLGGQCFYKTIYWHLCSVNDPKFAPKIPTDGQGHPVKTGDLIGYADSTGLSTGDHLHFGLKPQAQNEENGAWYNPAQNNGYNGAIDPTPFFTGLFAEDIPTAQTVLNHIEYQLKNTSPNQLPSWLNILFNFLKSLF